MRKNKNKKEISRVGILGFGEVGQAIAKFYKNPKIKDLKRKDGLKEIEVLHICIPWSDDFVRIVKEEIKTTRSRLTIIHSTVAPGATKKIISSLPNDLKMVVHSPVRGAHPNLYPGIKTFVKYIGAEEKQAGRIAKEHLESLGIKTEVFIPSVTTELGKLFSTCYYALCIAWHGEMEKICGKAGVNFNQAVSDFNESYNDGYATLKKKNVVRPILSPPQKGIGGHCLIPNAKILKKYQRSKALDLILEYQPNEK